MVGRRIGAVLLALALGGGLAACGDDGDGDSDAVEQVDRDDTGADDGNGDDSSDDGSDDQGDPDIDLPDGIFGSEECAEIVRAVSAFGAIFAGDTNFDFPQLAEALDEVAEDAPEVADDLATMAAVYRDFGEVVGSDVDFSDPATFTDPAITAAAAGFSSPEFTAASQNVSNFMDEVCTQTG